MSPTKALVVSTDTQDFPELAGVIAGMDDPADAPWRVEVRFEATFLFVGVCI